MTTPRRHGTSFLPNLTRRWTKLDLEFKMTQDEDDGRNFYAMVNRKGDELAQLATDYTPAEISFFKAVLEQIMLAPHEAYSVSSLAALRELSHLKLNMTKAQAEVLLSTFVARGWLKKSKRGRYALALRSCLELLPYLKSTYPNEIIECTICSEFLTRGVACTSPKCNVRLHTHCATRYFARPKRPCPACQTPWTSKEDLKPVGEDAAREQDDMRRRTRARTQDSDEEDEAEESGQEIEERARTQTKSKGKGKGKVKAKGQVDTDEDVDMDDDEDVKPSQAPRRSSRRQ
ncbi:hypothetical protein NMY22_g9601 [Coprinellus aureogranulatus]|nr:hypothetical protein NMY22_g9601 [Coprinellus aureogranulatus]